jgi:hypothetical protein
MSKVSNLILIGQRSHFQMITKPFSACFFANSLGASLLLFDVSSMHLYVLNSKNGANLIGLRFS